VFATSWSAALGRSSCLTNRIPETEIELRPFQSLLHIQNKHIVMGVSGP
jgi:hypothetical protein